MKPTLTPEVEVILKRVDEDARGTRCLTMAEVTICLNLLKSLIADLQRQAQVREIGARLDEAKWWAAGDHASTYEESGCEIQNCRKCNRLAELTRAKQQTDLRGE